MVEFSLANAADFIDGDELDEEPGEEIESAPPLQLGEEREISSSGIKKMLIKHGINWETPEVGDEATVRFVGKLLDETEFLSTRDKDPFTLKIGTCQVVSGLDRGIVTMRKGEIALFTIPHELGYGVAGTELVPPNSSIKFVVELVSWITVVDVCKDGGIIKKIVEKGEQIGPPGDLDEVRVKYTAVLDDDTVVAKTPEEGLEFHVKDGHICPALPKAIKTMKKGEKVKLFIQPQYAFEDRKENRSDFSPPDMNSTLRIDLELLSFKPSIDVSGDLKVLKKILKEGEGSFTANEGASVTVRYTAMLEDGTVFERKGFDAGQPLEFVTDEEHVIPGLDRAAMTMRKGEIALLTIHPEFGFGNSEVQRDLAIVPPRSTINYEIEMLDFTREKAPWEMSDQERIEAATRKKEEGNLLFKNEKYQRARKKYDKAVDYVCEDGSFGDNDLKLVKSLRAVCWLNGAACSLKENDFQEAVKLCSKVLDIECSNVKALYRRAQAYMGTADLQLAELDVKRALETDPQNREMKQLQKNLKQLQAESNKRDSNLYSTMFSGKRKGTSPAIKRLKIDNGEERELIEDVITTEMEKAAVNSESPDEGMGVDSC